MNVLKWFVIGIVVLLLSGVAVLFIGSWISLDRDYSYTQDVELLPDYADFTGSSGIVRIEANGYEFRARVAGFDRDASNAETIILLHGFPVTSAMWELLIEPLAEAGYRVLAFDQRGYSPGARPKDESAYGIPHLVSDVVAVAASVGAQQFHLIGHDWGSAVGWTVTMTHPGKVLTWTGISIAHPTAFVEALQNDPDQQSRSRYFGLFTTALLPELLLTFNDGMLLKAMYSEMLDSQRQEYHRVFMEPAALTSALNWYRQMGTSLENVTDIDPEIETPTLFIWGNDDPAVGRTSVEAQAKFLTGSYREIELAGGHWLVADFSDEITQAVLKHLGK
ncbi:MAG: pimeloyl-ACP methyl ester carboxylesterase [Candidatus Azotimanducaceae bacterium]|jgi:pimeloyl-ACP methyl ester carboxylesterase